MDEALAEKIRARVTEKLEGIDIDKQGHFTTQGNSCDYEWRLHGDKKKLFGVPQ